MKAEDTSIKITCTRCGTDHLFNLGEIVEAANLPPDENHLVHRITQPCKKCGGPIDVEIDLVLDDEDAPA